MFQESYKDCGMEAAGGLEGGILEPTVEHTQKENPSA